MRIWRVAAPCNDFGLRDLRIQTHGANGSDFRPNPSLVCCHARPDFGQPSKGKRACLSEARLDAQLNFPNAGPRSFLNIRCRGSCCDFMSTPGAMATAALHLCRLALRLHETRTSEADSVPSLDADPRCYGGQSRRALRTPSLPASPARSCLYWSKHGCIMLGELVFAVMLSPCRQESERGAATSASVSSLTHSWTYSHAWRRATRAWTMLSKQSARGGVGGWRCASSR